ncbi:MAG: FHA domain-containing protein [Gammaproteobacteria bacterium]|nr:FHA domain-containing protein [Gammaproteobacteria bacterium]
MAKLVLSFNGDIIKEYTLDSGLLSIGRESNSDIHIDNPAASDKHAKVLTILDKSFIEDLDSTNGTYINRHKITGHSLQNGDAIFIGEHELIYVKDNAESTKSDFKETITTIDPDTEGIPETEEANRNSEKSIGKIVAELYSSVTASEEPGQAKLKIISGKNTGKELPLSKTLTTLGRPDIQVAAITHRPTDYFLIVVDAGKDNKMPLVNGSEIDKQQALADGDIIEVAGVQMRFNLI